MAKLDRLIKKCEKYEAEDGLPYCVLHENGKYWIGRMDWHLEAVKKDEGRTPIINHPEMVWPE